MAGIDKTYVKTWSQLKEVLDWAKTIGDVTDDFGNTLNPMWWLEDWTEEYFNECIDRIRTDYSRRFKNKTEYEKAMSSDYYKDIHSYEEWCAAVDTWPEIAMWNTPEYFDIWLIRNCPITFIQERLKFQYGDDYDLIKNRTSEYDTYVRPATGKHFTVDKHRIAHHKYWWIEVIDYVYNGETDTWKNMYLEPGPWTCSDFDHRGEMNKHVLSRLIKKWNLPIGAKLYVRNRYWKDNFMVTIKK